MPAFRYIIMTLLHPCVKTLQHTDSVSIPYITCRASFNSVKDGLAACSSCHQSEQSIHFLTCQALPMITSHMPLVACTAGIESVPTWMPAMMGATVGGLYAALNRAGMRKFWRSPSTQLSVVITGGGKGIGKAIAREFLRSDSCHACHANLNLCVYPQPLYRTPAKPFCMPLPCFLFCSALFLLC